MNETNSIWDEIGDLIGALADGITTVIQAGKGGGGTVTIGSPPTATTGGAFGLSTTTLILLAGAFYFATRK